MPDYRVRISSTTHRVGTIWALDVDELKQLIFSDKLVTEPDGRDGDIEFTELAEPGSRISEVHHDTGSWHVDALEEKPDRDRREFMNRAGAAVLAGLAAAGTELAELTWRTVLDGRSCENCRQRDGMPASAAGVPPFEHCENEEDGCRCVLMAD